MGIKKSMYQYFRGKASNFNQSVLIQNVIETDLL